MSNPHPLPPHSPHLPQSAQTPTQAPVPPSIRLICADLSTFYSTYRQACQLTQQVASNHPSLANLPKDQLQAVVEQCAQQSKQFTVFTDTLQKLILRLPTAQRGLCFDLVFGFASRVLIEREILPQLFNTAETVTTHLLQTIALILESVLLQPPSSLKKLQLASLQSYSSLLFFFISFFKPSFQSTNATNLLQTGLLPDADTMRALKPNVAFHTDILFALFRCVQCLLLIVMKIDYELISMALLSQPLFPLLQLLVGVCVTILPLYQRDPTLQQQALMTCDIVRATLCFDSLYITIPPSQLDNSEHRHQPSLYSTLNSAQSATTQLQYPHQSKQLYWSYLFAYQRAIKDTEQSIKAQLAEQDIDAELATKLGQKDERDESGGNCDKTMWLQYWSTLPSIYLLSSQPSVQNSSQQSQHAEIPPTKLLGLLQREYYTLLLLPHISNASLTTLFSSDYNSIELQQSPIKLRTLHQKRDKLLIGSESFCSILPGLLSICYNMLTTNTHTHLNSVESNIDVNRRNMNGTRHRVQDQFTTVLLLQLWTNTIVSCCSDQILRLLLTCPRHLKRVEDVAQHHGNNDINNNDINNNNNNNDKNGAQTASSNSTATSSQSADTSHIHPTLQLLFQSIPILKQNEQFSLSTILAPQNINHHTSQLQIQPSSSITTSPTSPTSQSMIPTESTVTTTSPPQNSTLPFLDPLTPSWLEITHNHAPFHLLYPTPTTPFPNSTPPPNAAPLTTASAFQQTMLRLENDPELTKATQELQFTGMRTFKWLSETRQRISDLIIRLYNPLLTPSYLMSTPYTLIGLVLSSFSLLYHCPVFLFDHRTTLLDIIIAGLYSSSTIQSHTSSLNMTPESINQPNQSQHFNDIAFISKFLIKTIFSPSSSTTRTSDQTGANSHSAPTPSSPTTFKDFLSTHFLTNLTQHKQHIDAISISILVGSQCCCQSKSQTSSPKHQHTHSTHPTHSDDNPINSTKTATNPASETPGSGWTISSLLFKLRETERIGINQQHLSQSQSQHTNTTNPQDHDNSPNSSASATLVLQPSRPTPAASKFDTYSTNLFELTIQRILALPRLFRHLSSSSSSSSSSRFTTTADTSSATLYALTSQQHFALQLVLGYLELIPSLSSLISTFIKVQRKLAESGGSGLAPHAQGIALEQTFTEMLLQRVHPVISALSQLLRLQVEPTYVPEATHNSSLTQISIYPISSQFAPNCTSSIQYSTIHPFHFASRPTHLIRQIPQRIVWAIGGTASLTFLTLLNQSIQSSLAVYTSSFVTWGLNLGNPLAQYQAVNAGATPSITHEGQQTNNRHFNASFSGDNFGNTFTNIDNAHSNFLDISADNDADSLSPHHTSDLRNALTRSNQENPLLQRTSHLLGMKEDLLTSLSQFNSDQFSSMSTTSVLMLASAGTAVRDEDHYTAGIGISALQQFGVNSSTCFKRSSYSRVISEISDPFGEHSFMEGRSGGNDGVTTPNDPFNQTYLLERIYLLYLMTIGVKSLIHYHLDVKTKRINTQLAECTLMPANPPPQASLQTFVEQILFAFFNPSYQSSPFSDISGSNPLGQPVLSNETLFTLPNQPHHLVSTSLSIIHNIASLSTSQSALSNLQLSPQGAAHLSMNYVYTTALQSLTCRLFPLLFSLSKPPRRQTLLASSPMLTQMLSKLALCQKQINAVGSPLTYDLQRSLFDISTLLYPPVLLSPMSPRSTNNNNNMDNNDQDQNSSTSQPVIAETTDFDAISTIIQNNIESIINRITLKLHSTLELHHLEMKLQALTSNTHNGLFDGESGFNNPSQSSSHRYPGTLHDVTSAIIQCRVAFQHVVHVFLVGQQEEGYFNAFVNSTNAGRDNNIDAHSQTQNRSKYFSRYSNAAGNVLFAWRNSVKNAESVLRQHEVVLEDRLSLPLLLQFILSVSNIRSVDPFFANGRSDGAPLVSFTVLRDVLTPTFELITILTRQRNNSGFSSTFSGSFVPLDADFIPSFDQYQTMEKEYISKQYQNQTQRYDNATSLSTGAHFTSSYDLDRECSILSFLATKNLYKYNVTMMLCYLDVLYTVVHSLYLGAKQLYETNEYNFWFEYVKRYIGRCIRDEQLHDQDNTGDNDNRIDRHRDCKNDPDSLNTSKQSKQPSTRLISVDSSPQLTVVENKRLIDVGLTSTHNDKFNSISSSQRDLQQYTLSLLSQATNTESYLASGQSSTIQLHSSSTDPSTMYLAKEEMSSKGKLARLREKVTDRLVANYHSKDNYKRFYLQQHLNMRSLTGNPDQSQEDLSTIWVSLQKKQTAKYNKALSNELENAQNSENPEEGLAEDYADSDFDEDVIIGRPMQSIEHTENSKLVLKLHQNREKRNVAWLQKKLGRRTRIDESLSRSTSTSPNINPSASIPPQFDPYLDDPVWTTPPKFNDYVNDDDAPRSSSIEEQQLEKLLFFISPLLTLPSLEPVIINKVLKIINLAILTMNFIGKLPHLYLTSTQSSMQNVRIVMSAREKLRHEYKQQKRAEAMHNRTYKPRKKNFFAGMIRSREGWDIDSVFAEQHYYQQHFEQHSQSMGHNDDVQADTDVPNQSDLNFTPDSKELDTIWSELRKQLLDPHPSDGINEGSSSGIAPTSPSNMSEIVFIDYCLHYILTKSHLAHLSPFSRQSYQPGSTNVNFTNPTLSPLLSSLLPSNLPTFPIHRRWDARLLPLITSLWPTVKLLLVSSPSPVHSRLSPASHSSLGHLSFIQSTLYVLATMCALSHGFFARRFVDDVFPHISLILTTTRNALLNLIHQSSPQPQHDGEVQRQYDNATHSQPMRILLHTLQLLKVIVITSPSIVHSLLNNAPITDSNQDADQISFVEILMSFQSPLLPGIIRVTSQDILTILLAYQKETVTTQLLRILGKAGIEPAAAIQLVQHNISTLASVNAQNQSNSNSTANLAQSNSNTSHPLHHDSSLAMDMNDSLGEYQPLHLNFSLLADAGLLSEDIAGSAIDKFSRREILSYFWSRSLSFANTNQPTINPQFENIFSFASPQTRLSTSSLPSASKYDLVEVNAGSTRIVEHPNQSILHCLQDVLSPSLPPHVRKLSLDSISSIVQLLANQHKWD